MLVYLASAAVGILTGAVSGLVPGLHVNTLALFLVWSAPVWNIDPLLIAIFLICAGTTHAFFDFIPSIFLGAPNEDTALATSPGHRMLLEGRGFEALAMCVTGGVMGVVFVLGGFFLLRSYAYATYSGIRTHLGLLLIAVSFLMVWIEKHKIQAALIFLLSGLFGIVSLNSGINEKFVMLPMLSGLFGASTLLLSYKTDARIPKQTTRIRLRSSEAVRGGLCGFLGGVLAGFLPGVGTSQSAIIVQRMFGLKGRRGFITAIGAISVCDVLLSIFALSFIGRARSGIAVAVETILSTPSIKTMYLFLGVGAFSAGISSLSALYVGRKFAKKAPKYRTKNISAVVLLFLFLMVVTFTGKLGGVVFITGAAIGILPHIVETKKSLLLACLLLPTTLYFLNIDGIVLNTLGL